MKPISSPQYPKGRRSADEAGVALVIVLAFVVIITGVILAFFSQSLFTRQISDASANQAKADLLAEGAAQSIIGDLQQEIELTSVATNYTAGTGGNQVTGKTYVPISPVYTMPQMSGTGSSTWAPNFLIRSAYNQPFFLAGAGVSSNIPASNNTGAINVSSTTPSLNGRSVSMARWNSHYLLPLTANSTDSTPDPTQYQPPDWVLVTRGGASPTSWNSSMANPGVTNNNYVIGRYAYTVYDEGGLLDANAAGYPTGANGNVTTTAQYANKASLAYADLTQLPGGFNQNSKAVDQLVAWRNYASANVTNGSFTQEPTFAQTSGSSYYNYVVNNTTGYLTVSGTTLNNGQSDRMFGSRQELIGFLQNGLGWSGNNLSALNYLSTFTRGIAQPSFAPGSNRPLITWPQFNGGNNVIPGTGGASYEINDTAGKNDPINPTFLSVRVSGTFTRNDGSTSILGEPLVKTRFALSRLVWLTYLGPSASRIKPTGNYDPTGGNPGVTSLNYDLWALVNLYGVPVSYLQEGTPANIQKYFGLVWQQDTIPGGVRGGQDPSFHDSEYKWFYAGHNTSTSGVPGTLALSNSTGAISRLGAIASLSISRDPDFFELLKAGVMAGSKAKGAVNITQSVASSLTGGVYHPYYYQALRDTSLDYAIIQLGANIIDEAKVDGYSTRIVFNDGGAAGPREFRGVQNLPYLYRISSGTMKLRMEAPVLGSVEKDTPANAALQDTGVGLVMHVPTIWNPYDENSPMGAPGPAGTAVPSSIGSAQFRLIADGVYPDYLQTTPANPSNPVDAGYTWWGAGSASHTYALSANNQVSSGNATGAIAAANTKIYTVGPNGTGGQITPSLTAGVPTTGAPFTQINAGNSQLTFLVPNTSLFREPTVLAQAGYPTGSNLAMAPPLGIVQYNTLLNSKGKNCWAGNGFLSDGLNPLGVPTPPAAAQPYCGICIGLFPIQFYNIPQSSGTGMYEGDIVGTSWNSAAPGPFVTYRLQYKDPNPADTQGNGWVTYDEKYTQYDTLFLYPTFGSNWGNLSNEADATRGGCWQAYDDPRTSRYSALEGDNLANFVQTPGGSDEPQEWADQGNDVEVTDRPDINSGFAISDHRRKNGVPPFANNLEFFDLAANGWTVGNVCFRLGMLEQNSPTIQSNGIRFTGDAAANNQGPEGPTYYMDPDGVVRPAAGAYVTGNSSVPASTTVGLPLATAFPKGYSQGSGPYQGQSRPFVLHRPYRSVAELGYAFSGTPWKNVDFFTSTSGDSGLLDIFTPNEVPENGNAVIAGVVNLNTRQTPVIQALLSGNSVDDLETSGSLNTGFTPMGRSATGQSTFSQQQWNSILNPSGNTNNNTVLENIAVNPLNQVPLANVSDMVSHYVSTSGTYTGLIGDLSNFYSSYAGYAGVSSAATLQNVDRFRESFIRPLLAVGQTRVWNLMIDVVAQTGRYPQGASSAASFVVDGEQRYWVHVAIDRYTGQIVDKQVEVVKD
jgi:Tfp pilus assembly protein PilX